MASRTSSARTWSRSRRSGPERRSSSSAKIRAEGKSDRRRTFYPGDHGGNLDTKEITKGNSVYLPVFQPGGQLAMGDLHALMADGEVCVTGIEIAGTVRVQADVLRGYGLHRPIVETPEAWLTVASAPTLDEAAKLATHDGVAFLARGTQLPWDEAYMLASIACDLRISQDVDPWRTA